jgi:hypothetical protein
MTRGLLRAACGAAIVVTLAGTGGTARGSGGESGSCTWGASSMTATYVNGVLVESQPQTTGCIP